MKYMMSRFGGIGDAVILTVVARELIDRGHEVHLSVPQHQVSLFDNLPECFTKVLETARFQGHIDCIKGKWGWMSVEAMKDEFTVFMGEKDRTFAPIDYKYSIELNANMGHAGRADYMGYWLRSQNSNFQNWVDLSLGWAGIDPQSVPDERKVPVYRQREPEKNWARRTLRGASEPIIGLHMFASSLSRTYYRHEDVAKALLEAYPTATIIHWMGDHWIQGSKAGFKRLELPEHFLRHSVSLVKGMDLIICADSALSHYAAAVDTPSITTYTTVPPWTRGKYYPKGRGIVGDVPCHPCFNLHRYCPLNQKRAEETLSDREKQMLELEQGGAPPPEAAKVLGTHVESLNHEYNAMRQRMEGIAGMVPDCVKDITPERILAEVKEVLGA